MSDQMTSNIDQPQPSLDDMLAGAEAALKQPVAIGHLFGTVVWLNLWDRTLTMDGNTFSVDDPLIAGSPLHTAALNALVS